MLNPAIEPENQISLHNLIDNLPETEKPTLRRILELLANLNSHEQSKAEQALQMFEQILERKFDIPEEEETLSPEEILEMEEGWKAYQRGEYITLEELEKELSDG